MESILEAGTQESVPTPVGNPQNRANADVSRRSLLRGVFLGLGAAGLPSWMLKDALAQPGGPALTIPPGPLGAQDYGPLVAQVVSDHLSGINHQLFAPAGFNVRVVMRAGINPVFLNATIPLGHINPDGGAVFMAPDGGWVYVSNSETTPGGVGAVRFNAAGQVVDYNRICVGTRNNCAGGQTPWGTWITCEEVNGGWCYECDPFSTTASQVQLTALGARNGREAVAIDPIHHVIYQTLDNGAGKFVRFRSNPGDLVTTPSGVTRMNMVDGVSERLLIPAFGSLPGFSNVVVPNNTTGSSQLRLARPIQWVEDSGTNGTNFNGGEGIWYYEIPEALRTIPTAGTFPTKGVIFFASKGDNRVWAIDIENSLIELIYDTQNNQAFPNLRNIGGTSSNFNQVDNVGVTPGGDVLVAEDGTAMRLAVMLNNQPAKLLMQITLGNSEITGPALTPDGSRLYFGSQRGPGGTSGTSLSGVIYEMTIPPRFRQIQKADAFGFRERLTVAPAVVVPSEPVTLTGFLGPLQLSISAGNGAEFSINGGAWGTAPVSVEAGAVLRVRHTSAPDIGGAVVTTVSVGLANGASRTDGVFRTVTSEPDIIPDPFDFGMIEDVPGDTLIESAVVVPTGFNLPVPIKCGPHAEYRIEGGAWTSANGSLKPEESLQMRHVSNPPDRAVRTTHVRLGEDVMGHFRTRTRVD